jgi:hypothetical protein
VRNNRVHSQEHTPDFACGPVDKLVERSSAGTGGDDGEKGSKSGLHFVVVRVDESENVKLLSEGDSKAREMVDW